MRKKFSPLFALTLALDQTTKAFIVLGLPQGQTIPLTSFLSIAHVKNTGVTFGMLQGHPQIMTLIVTLVIAFLVYKRKELATNKLTTNALHLILAGAVGNLIDRIAHGAVTDFIAFSFWPAFNVADTAICIGALLFIKDMVKN